VNITIDQIPTTDLIDHPHNPRLVLREDVIEVIKTQIEAHGFSEAHPIHARPFNGKFQIISGHQRREAARRAKLKTVPCVIEEMSDERAMMLLALDNMQGELSPAELAYHVFLTVKKAGAGRGNKGGLSAYAEEAGITQQAVSLRWDAGEVVATIKSTSAFVDFNQISQARLLAVRAEDSCALLAVVNYVLNHNSSRLTSGRW
jgi:hypothetical protein